MLCVCVCVCVCACVRACVRACVCVCVRACVLCGVVGFCCDPRAGGATGALQRGSLLYPGAWLGQAPDCSLTPQQAVLAAAYHLHCDCLHQGELHQGSALEDWEIETRQFSVFPPT